MQTQNKQNRRMSLAPKVVAASIVALFLFAFAVEASAQVKVVATLPTIATIARDIGGEHVEVKTLSSPSQDPHYVDPRPSLLVSLSRADLLLVNGLELEVGWLPPLLLNARNANIQVGSQGYVDVSTVVERLNVQTNISRAQGDIHPGGNPHFTVDPRAGVAIADLIRARLVAVDPGNKAAYDKRYEAFEARLGKLAKEQFVRFSKVSPTQRQVVVYHDSWPYLLNWLHVKQIITVEPKPGITPTPSHVAKVLGVMRKTQTKTIIQERFYPAKTSQNLAKLAKGELVLLDGGANFDKGESYEAYVKRLADAIYEAVK